MARNTTRNSNKRGKGNGKVANGNSRNGVPQTGSRNDGSDNRKPTNTSRMAPAISNIISASSTIAVRNVAGNPIDVSTKNRNAAMSCAAESFTVPGIVRMRFAPVFGVARGSQTDPVNLAARNMWMNLRSLYSNRIPYTAGAIVMYAMALDSILMAFHVIRRAYGVVFAYDARNRYIPDGLLRAMGFNPVDFRANLPQIKTFLNKIAAQFSAFGVPTELRFITDHIDMCNHVYMDGATPNAQYIVPVPDFYWKMDWTNNKLSGGELFSDGLTWSAIEQIVTDYIEAFVNNEDVYMIAGDMLRLYGSLATISPVPSDFMIGPEYSEEFLIDMHNATVGGINIAHTAALVTKPWEVSELQAPENVGAIVANYCTEFSVPHNQDTLNLEILATVSPGLYDFHTTVPTEDEVVRTSNWKWYLTATKSTVNNVFYRVETCGTFLLQSMQLLTLIDDPENPDIRRYMEISVHPVPGNFYPTDLLTAVSVVKDHPYLPIYEASFETVSGKLRSNSTIKGYIGDYDQYFTLDVDELARIHEAIVLDRFDAAGIGTLNLHAK